MIDNRKLTKEYYLNHMSMFLKNSYGMIDREEIYRAVLNNVNNIGIQLALAFNIFEPDSSYFENLGYSPDSIEGPILDIIASFYGLSRNLKINYNGSPISIFLTNRELKIYICVTIVKINYQGTFEEIKNLYSLLGIDIEYSFGLSPKSLNCVVNCTNINDFGTMDAPTNLGYLFLTDKILIESMGIKYTKIIGDVDIAEFDDDSKGKFDNNAYVFGA